MKRYEEKFDMLKGFIWFALDVWRSAFFFLLLLFTPIAIMYGMILIAMWFVG